MSRRTLEEAKRKKQIEKAKSQAKAEQQSSSGGSSSTSSTVERLRELQEQQQSSTTDTVERLQQLREEQEREEAISAPKTPNKQGRISCRDLAIQEMILSTSLEDDTNTEEQRKRSIAIAKAKAKAKAKIKAKARKKSAIDAAKQRAKEQILDNAQENLLLEAATADAEKLLNTEEDEDDLDDQIIEEIAENESTFKDSPFLGLGRNAIISNRQDYATSIKNISDAYRMERSLIEDKIKYYNGSFYVLMENSSLNFYKNVKDKISYFSRYEQRSTQGNQESSNFYLNSKFLPKTSREQDQFVASFINGGSIRATIQTSGQEDIFSFQPLIDNTKIFQDNTFSMQLPFENSELLNTMNLMGASIIDAKENYNFYIKEYEKIADKTNDNSTENTLPNLYVLNSISENSDDENVVLLNSLSPASNSQTNMQSAILPFSLNQLLDVKDNSEQYFETFALNYNLVSQENKTFIDNKNKNVILLLDTTNKLNEISKRKFSFPMFMEFSIPTDKTTNICKMLIDSELMNNFMIKLFELYKNNQFTKIESAISENIFTQIIDQEEKSVVQNSFNSKIKDVNYANIDQVLDSLTFEQISLSDPSYIVIGDTEPFLRETSSMMKFVNNLKSVIFKGKVQTFANKNKRTYSDILKGKKCYNETLAFRVSKYLPNSLSPIQNYWIPNNPDLDVMTLIDSQVKYDKQYVYKIFAYQMVLGNSLRHVSATKSTLLGKSIAVNVVTENVLQKNLMEVEIFSSNKQIIDTPPLSPEIQFIPYRGIDNQVGLFLNSRTGQEKLQSINILSSDNDITSKYKKDINNLILYKTDDIPKRFEIMKLLEKPKSYSDFSKGTIIVLNTDINPETIQTAGAAAYIDSIEPNKKYYYCFRTVDVHEKISNPSQVFEFEMVNEKGMIFPIVKNYEFEKPKYNNVLEMRRFIKIKPASQHTFLNSQLSNIKDDQTAEVSLNKVKLGLTDVGVPWGKTFKMVVTSKQTGKKCEIKFKFASITE